ncbi:hypothetical protein [Mycobacterium avium]|nr:hypothetical protein [Mycobacterium avium]
MKVTAMVADSGGLRLIRSEPNVWQISPDADVLADLDTDDFWTATPVLQRVRQFARSRRVGPYSMLGVALVKATSSIPPYVVLPPTRGSYGSLNLYVALVGPSGTTKSTSMAAGRDYLRTVPNVPVSQPGSGEGLAKCFAYVSGKGSARVQEGSAWSVIGFVPEVASMLQTASRGGATLMADWRSGWSGERLGKDYADDGKRVVIMDHRYRLTYVLGVVPMLAKELFDGAHVGTPQRILWMPTSDPNCPRTPPEAPKRRVLNEWPSRTPDRVHGADREVALCAVLDQPVQAAEFETLQLPTLVTDLIDEQAVTALSRDLADDAEENHDLFNQLKVAAAIMRLHKRTTNVTETDWQLAGHLLAISTGLRDETQRLISTTTYRQQVKAAHVQGKLADAVSSAQDHQALRRVRALLQRYLIEAGGEMSSSDLRNRLSSRDREPYYDSAIGRLQADGLIERKPIQYNGIDGHQIRLV